jgi:DNA repair exonuclease SbcCD nuclease subunit
MLSFLFRTDVHLADRGPASWKGDYQAEVLSSLEQVGRMARKYKVKAVLDGGDFFHVKAATRNSHGLVVKTADVHRAYPCPTYAVEGNHDLAYNNLATVGKQPLGVMFSTGVFLPLRDEVFTGDGLQARVVGVPYSPQRTLDELREIRKQDGDHYLVAVVHALAGENPPGGVEDFFNEPVFRYEDLVYDEGPDVWCFGHWHKDQGIVEVGGRRFVNQGALSRGALVKENLERTPKVALIEFSAEGISTGLVPLKVAPAAEVFDLERKERRDAESREIERFVERLQEDAKADPSESVEANVAALDFAPEVRDLALEYLGRARGE